MSLALNDSLIRLHGSCMHIDPDERPLTGSGQAKTRRNVITKNIESEGKLTSRLSDGLCRYRHGGHGLRRHCMPPKGKVPEILNHDGLGSTLLVGLRIGNGGRTDLAHRSSKTGSTREGFEVHYPDQGFVLPSQCLVHTLSCHGERLRKTQ